MSTEQIDDDENNPYVIVLFLPKKAPEVEEIEIVPSTWLTSNNKHCRYPPASDYQHVEKWAKELKKCIKSWHIYKVEIVAYAKNWKQAERRLKRACISNDIKSTDEELKNSSPEILSEKSIKKLLGAVPKMTSSHKTSSLINDSTIGEEEKEEAVGTTILVSDNHHQSSASGVQQAAIVSESNIRQLMGALDKEEKEAIAEMDPLLQPLQKYIEILFRKQTLNIQNYIDSSKISMMYDLTRNTKHLQNQIIANSQNKSPVPTASLVEIKKKINDDLPISDLEAFKKFDENLTLENKDKYESFLNLIRVCTFGQTKVVDCVHKIFPEILKKTVELNYSGTGKKVHGVGKLNFSSTNTFQCIESVIREKFPDQPQTAKLRTLVGTWLSGAPDRERGRATRVQQALEPRQDI